MTHIDAPHCGRTNPYDRHEAMPRTPFDRWGSMRNIKMLTERQGLVGKFQRDLIDLFKFADDIDRLKLVKAYPWLWMDRRECKAEATEFWEGKCADECEECEGTKLMTIGQGPEEEQVPCTCTEPDPDELFDRQRESL